MQRHLNKTRAAQRVLNEAELSLRRECVAGVGIETGIERNVIVWSIETRVIQNVEEIGLILQGETFGEFRFLQNLKIHPGLEWGPENVATAA